MNEKYISIALKEAEKALKKDEVPIGAVIVKDNKIIAKAHNLCEVKDCTGHAEILAIRKACGKLGTSRLWDCDLYVTLEPCAMCAAAISFARIKNLCFGAYDEKGGGTSFYTQKTCHHKPNVQGGILESECSKILKDFFRKKRQSIS